MVSVMTLMQKMARKQVRKRTMRRPRGQPRRRPRRTNLMQQEGGFLTEIIPFFLHALGL